MVTLNAHYDGKALILDEPLDLPTNQKVRIQVEPIEADPSPKPRTDWASMIGIGNDKSEMPHDPGLDEDALWGKGPLADRKSR